jgi:hypothetical protein
LGIRCIWVAIVRTTLLIFAIHVLALVIAAAAVFALQLRNVVN